MISAAQAKITTAQVVDVTVMNLVFTLVIVAETSMNWTAHATEVCVRITILQSKKTDNHYHLIFVQHFQVSLLGWILRTVSNWEIDSHSDVQFLEYLYQTLSGSKMTTLSAMSMTPTWKLDTLIQPSHKWQAPWRYLLHLLHIVGHIPALPPTMLEVIAALAFSPLLVSSNRNRAARGKSTRWLPE